MTSNQHWLAAWLDVNEITHDWELANLLRTPTGVESLTAFVEEAAQRERTGQIEYPNSDELGTSIVAGRRMDLSGTISCGVYECLQAEVDSTFTRIWHYFDRIVAEGACPVSMFHTIKYAKSHDQVHLAFDRLVDQARLIIYLRSIGAERYTIFSHKPHAFCQEHWEEHAKSLGLFDAFSQDSHEKLAQKIVRSSKIEVAKSANEGAWVVDVRGPFFQEPYLNLVWGPKKLTKHSVACHIITEYATAMISDVGLARGLNLPLVEPINMPWLRKGRKGPMAVDQKSVALQLDLPVFDSLAPGDFLKLREDQKPYFENFRAGLRKEIDAHISAAEAGTPTSVIAKRIEEDYLRRGLAEIEAQAFSSRKALVKKSAVTLSVGTTTTLVGALNSIPLIIGAGIAAIVSSTAQVVNSYMDDRKSIEKSNLYFLWQANKQATHK